MTTNELDQGLMEFYSSQADVLLAQWKNIENLLGTTTDYTAPGTHCEILLRDFLRRHLPEWIKVDKGFVYGRSKRIFSKGTSKSGTDNGYTEKDLHGPEIDILIHDSLSYRPVFRLEDFVIVQPESVIGMIQIKRSFQSNQISKAIQNIVDAKRHILECYFTKNISRLYFPERDIFCAAIEFKSANRQNETFKSQLIKAYESQEPYEDHENNIIRAKTWILPDFVGSLDGKYVSLASRTEAGECTYQVLPGDYDGQNIALQEFLIRLTSKIWKTNEILKRVEHEKPPLAQNLDVELSTGFYIPERTS